MANLVHLPREVAGVRHQGILSRLQQENLIHLRREAAGVYMRYFLELDGRNLWGIPNWGGGIGFIAAGIAIGFGSS